MLATVINVKPQMSVKHATVITLSYQTSTSATAYYVKFLIVILAPSKTFAQTAQVTIKYQQPHTV